MTDIISFDVELTQNQKLARDKLNQVHQLYDEIEKLLGTQGVFKRPHLFMALPKKEPLTNEEWFNGLSTEEKAMVIICCCPYESDWFGDNFEKRMEQRIKDISKATYGYEHGVNKIKNWLKAVHKE